MLNVNIAVFISRLLDAGCINNLKLVRVNGFQVKKHLIKTSTD